MGNPKNLADAFLLTPDQIESFKRDGYLVVHDVLTREELCRATKGLHETLKYRYGVDPDNLSETAQNLRALSSTNGSGGILDVFYPQWKLELSENEKFIAIISQLWSAGFRNKYDDWEYSNEQCLQGEDYRDHPYGPFDVNRGYIYIDRICYRIPTTLSKEIGANRSLTRKKKWPLQRSLTPHLDCCPTTILKRSKDVSKWRPLQSFVSLTDSLLENTGGFECVKGFHHEFSNWACHRKESVGKGGVKFPAPCVGDFTPIRPVEDADVLARVCHVPCKAGSFVIWDNRLPHSNARFNHSNHPRAVVYISYLPDVVENRLYIQKQLEKYRKKIACTDQWVDREDGTLEDEMEYKFSEFGKRLMAKNFSDEFGSKLHQVYVDVEPINTTRHLETIQSLPIYKYSFAHERARLGDNIRSRIGVILTENNALVDDFVEVIPKRALPPTEKGGSQVILRDFPAVDEQKLFMYGIGAVQELSKQANHINYRIVEHVEHLSKMTSELNRLKSILTTSSEKQSEVHIKKAEIEENRLKMLIDLDIQKAKEEEEYVQRAEELERIKMEKNEELVKARLLREDESARKRAEAMMQKKLDTAKRLEESKEKAASILSDAEYERQIKLQEATELLKAETAKTIATAKAAAERENEDIHLRRLQAEAESRRIRNIAALESIYEHLATSLSYAVDNPSYVLRCIGYFALSVLSIFITREASKLCRIMVEATIGRPKLVRETTRKSSLVTYILFICDAAYLFVRKVSGFIGSSNACNSNSTKVIREKCERIFHDLILPTQLKERVLSFAISATTAKRNGAPNRHILLHGSPGTGKTFVARKLATCLGMDYALMSGGDISPLGPEAVTQIHSLFMWAKMAKATGKGVLLFIDEAEAFLASRSKTSLSESTHNALNALLYNTGGDSDVLLVLATNRAEDLDAAILDRCDVNIYFPLPDENCRRCLLLQYFRAHVQTLADISRISKSDRIFSMRAFIPKQNTTHDNPVIIDKDVMDESQLDEAARITEGFSGREIAKMMLSMQSFLNSSLSKKLTRADAWSIINEKVEEHNEKQRMLEVSKPAHNLNYDCDSGEGDEDSRSIHLEKDRRVIKNTRQKTRYSFHRYGSFSHL